MLQEFSISQAEAAWLAGEEIGAPGERGFIVYADGLRMTSINPDASPAYNCIKYHFNTLTFGSACSEPMTAWVYINPYVIVDTIPVPIKPRCMRGVLDAVKDVPDPAIVWDHAQYPINDMDQLAWHVLPGGWTTLEKSQSGFVGLSGMCYEYVRTTPMFPLSARFLQTCVPLHPTHPRPLSSDELAAIRAHSFNAWIESELNKFAIGEIAQAPYLLDHNIISSHTPTNIHDVLVMSPFVFQHDTTKLKRLKSFLAANPIHKDYIGNEETTTVDPLKSEWLNKFGGAGALT